MPTWSWLDPELVEMMVPDVTCFASLKSLYQ